MAVVNIIYVASPKRIVLGGGVMEQLQLFPRIHYHVIQLTNNYLASPVLLDHIETYIVPPGLGTRSGMLGAIELARLAAEGV
jgi:fructokinase